MVSSIQIVQYAILIGAIFLGYKIRTLLRVPPLPEVSLDKYWGPGSPPATVDMSIRPFKISFDLVMVTDLKNRLNRTRYTEPLEGVAFNYGFNSKALKPIIEFWEHKYDFSERENFLNQFPQFVTNIQGLDIHFIHIKPQVKKGMKVLPLLMLHGWPGSVREFYRIIPMLTSEVKGSNIVFELIVPSLPGYGFSQAASKPGLGATQIGVVMLNLMKRLGHQQFYIQGGDWGAIITSSMATLFSQHILGYHTNMPLVNTPMVNIKTFLGSFWPSLIVDKEYEHRMYPLKTRFSSLLLETGYFHIQATKPDTVGTGISDSPAGLAAYILEKFSTATDPDNRQLQDGGLTKKFTFTDLIDNLMMYWVSNAATTAVRLYAESFNKEAMALGVDSIPTIVPTAAARFPHELAYVPDCFLREKYPNLVQSTDFPRGGHFAAFEEPKLLADDIRSAVDKFIAFNEEAEAQKKEL